MRVLLILILLAFASATQASDWEHDCDDAGTANVFEDDGVGGDTLDGACLESLQTAVGDNDARIDALLTTDSCTTPPCSLTAGTTLGGVAIQTGTDDDVPESGDFGAGVDLEADGSLSADVVAAAEMANADHGDISWTGGVASIDANTVALSTDTTGNYVATIADSGASEVTVTGSGSEGAAVTLAISAAIARTADLFTYTVSGSSASGSCTAGDLWLETATPALYACTSTNTWEVLP